MIIFYYYKEDTWNNLSFFQQHYRWLHVFNESVIQKHMSRVSSSLENREKSLNKAIWNRTINRKALRTCNSTIHPFFPSPGREF